MFKVKLKETKAGKFRVCLVSKENGKLVTQGEPLTNRLDAVAIAEKFRKGEISPEPVEFLPFKHKFPKNSGSN